MPPPGATGAPAALVGRPAAIVLLDRTGEWRHPSGMSESPYAIPLEELMRTARAPVTELVVEQPLQAAPPTDWSCGVPLGDGGCDADGE